MNNEIKEILEKLKDNIPIEEYRSEGTSDGLTHYEEDKDSWQYKLYGCITNLQEQLHQASLDIQELTERDIWCPSNCDKLTNLQEKYEEADEAVKYWQNQCDLRQMVIDKAIEYNKKNIKSNNLDKILHGENNE